MSQFLHTVDAGCASLDAFSRSRALASPPARLPGRPPPPALTAPLPFTRHPSPVTRLSDRARIVRSIVYMQDHLTERMQVSHLAARINVSASYFFALFKRQTGFAPIDFFIHLRMRRACHLLNHTRLSVKEIAAQLGYDDAFYFSRLFKSVVTLAPSDYRVLPLEARQEIVRRLLPEKLLVSGAGWANTSCPTAAVEPQRARA